MFGGGNNINNSMLFVEGNQMHCDSNGPARLQLFGNIVDATNCLAQTNVPVPNKRSREVVQVDDAGRPSKPQMSLNNFYQNTSAEQSVIAPPNFVSTGLRLSCDDEEYNSFVTSASASKALVPTVTSFGDSLRAELDRQKEELHHYIRVQEENITRGLKEMQQRHMASFLSSINNIVGKQLREKDIQIQSLNIKSKELMEKINQVALEAQSWQQRAHYSRSVVHYLKSHLKKVLEAQEAADQTKEGFGENNLDDVTSSYHLNSTAQISSKFKLPRDNKNVQLLVCKACKMKEVRVLLLPCRHLCMCWDCSLFIDVCPVCQTVKTASFEILMSSGTKYMS